MVTDRQVRRLWRLLSRGKSLCAASASANMTERTGRKYRDLGKLPSEEQQRALRLLLLDEMDYEEIARAMAAQLNTVRSWIRRARIAVRECLSSYYRFDEALED